MKLEPITSEEQLTDNNGWLYRDDQHRPNGRIAQLMNLISETEFESQELDWEECLKLALYIDNVAAFENLTPERLNQLWDECEENFQGEFSTAGLFAEEYFCTTGQVPESAIADLVVDWDMTYQYSLQYDFFSSFVLAKNEASNEIEVKNYFWRNV